MNHDVFDPLSRPTLPLKVAALDFLQGSNPSDYGKSITAYNLAEQRVTISVDIGLYATWLRQPCSPRKCGWTPF